MQKVVSFYHLSIRNPAQTSRIASVKVAAQNDCPPYAVIGGE
jgi:hypothetical protein